MRTFATLALAVFLLGCAGEADHELADPAVVRLGVLPDQSKESVVAKYAPLVDYLSRQTGLDIELVVPVDYAAMVRDFSAHRIHLANFGGLTFTEAERTDHAEPLVMRDTDLRFASCYLVTAADKRKSLDEFRGETFSFGPELSTSGHLMPRYFLKAAEIDPEAFFASTRHSAGHDETARWVRDGVVAIGVANCMIVEGMHADGRLGPDDIRVLETTPAYADYVWAVHEHMGLDLKIRLRDAFMALDATDAGHRAILQTLGATAYLPASRADFNDVRRAARDVDVAAMLGLE
ncbi:MAG: phosphate/phosphite/phosphonate ABC transporter substrate-binding protein [Woeseiaceae bacterium]|nr:phosphate/phosphite/phosphonate ABC transporter substrate-binding protein [Woeseiaceae bacterium]